MSFPEPIWSQLKGKSADELVKALVRDGWILDKRRGSIRVYRHSDGRHVAIHYHPNKTHGPALLKALLKDIGWSVDDMRRLKLIK